MSTLEFHLPGPSNFDASTVASKIALHSQRFGSALTTLTAEEWAAPTRCAEWTVHDVVRHLCDTHELAARIEATSVPFEGFDPRTTPQAWLARSDGATPQETLERYTLVTARFVAVARERLERGDTFDVQAPYRHPVDWTVLMMHLFWDAWIHERDVLLSLGRPQVADDTATRYVTAYVTFLSGVVARMFGTQLEVTLQATGAGGGTFSLQVGESVSLVCIEDSPPAGPAAASIADALTGRGPSIGEIADLDSSVAAVLSLLATYFNTPA